MKKALRRILLVVVVLLLLAVGGIALRIRYLTGGGDYSRVASIQKTVEYQSPELLEKAWALPVAALYRKQGMDWQSNPSFCGPTSVVNLIRSVGQPSDQSSILQGTPFKTYFGLLPGGMTLDDLGSLLHEKSGQPVTVLRDLTRNAFRAEIARANDPSLRYIVNLHRGPLFGTGGGHFSPIAGYLPESDLVLVLDVNQKYQPWLVKTHWLYEAVDTLDRSSGKKRGLLRVNVP